MRDEASWASTGKIIKSCASHFKIEFITGVIEEFNEGSDMIIAATIPIL